jgi:hypothetical protein
LNKKYPLEHVIWKRHVTRSFLNHDEFLGIEQKVSNYIQV